MATAMKMRPHPDPCHTHPIAHLTGPTAKAEGSDTTRMGGARFTGKVWHANSEPTWARRMIDITWEGDKVRNPELQLSPRAARLSHVL
eukprot:6228038-Pyramimonas_sp.AAC.1